MIAQLVTAVMVAVAPIAVEASPPVKAEVARVVTVAAASSDPLPAGRVVWTWYDPHTPGLLGMPIGPPCWGLAVIPRFSFKTYTACVPEGVWKNHRLGSWYGPSD